MKIRQIVRHKSMPRGYWFLSAFFNFLDGLANMMLFPFGCFVDISAGYQQWAYRQQKADFEIE